MIKGLHAMFYSSDAEATRAFLRDVLEFDFNDVGGGWLIFDMPEADLGVHPVNFEGAPKPNTHDISFYCDDVKATRAALEAKGVTFTMDITDQGYGFVTAFEIPGGIRAELYEPKYTKGSGDADAG